MGRENVFGGKSSRKKGEMSRKNVLGGKSCRKSEIARENVSGDESCRRKGEVSIKRGYSWGRKLPWEERDGKRVFFPAKNCYRGSGMESEDVFRGERCRKESKVEGENVLKGESCRKSEMGRDNILRGEINRLLAVTNDAKAIMMGKNPAPLKRGERLPKISPIGNGLFACG